MVGCSWFVAGYFQEKRGRSVSGRGKMQTADIREPGKRMQSVECEGTENLYLKMTAKLLNAIIAFRRKVTEPPRESKFVQIS